ncbi:MAG: DUF3800 domain-containing protein [Mycolicibacter arupensis]|jgi:hypothetical protein|uniref:DUF3800 domain-containing protein n=2 Tax=Mycolicibacter arupensis TaxID=342002 RepID=A0A5C7XLF6_9MYCO|nr:MAG: DUF3800 domain-containing protein [Mycolicibacter arupensis]
MYADETGNLDYSPDGKDGATDYFGFGTAVFRDETHGEHLYGGLRLRARLESTGVLLPKGFHAVNDAKQTKGDMFNLIRQQAPRFDTTFLYKSNAYSSVKAKGEMYLYKMAWYLHFKEIALRVCSPQDELCVIVGTIATAARRNLAKAALEDVCQQVNRVITLCYWDAATSWGLQVADYGLWAVQRHLNGKNSQWFTDCVNPTLQSCYTPWGRKS